MTYLDAAFAVLQAAKQPLHYAEITRRALEQGLIVPTGLTPEATMGSRLYTDTQEEGSRFVRAGKGRFDMYAPAPIPGTALYVETNLSARHILQLVDALLAGLGYPTDQLEFHLPATNS